MTNWFGGWYRFPPENLLVNALVPDMILLEGTSCTQTQLESCSRWTDFVQTREYCSEHICTDFGKVTCENSKLLSHKLSVKFCTKCWAKSARNTKTAVTRYREPQREPPRNRNTSEWNFGTKSSISRLSYKESITLIRLQWCSHVRQESRFVWRDWDRGRKNG